jgi:hydroxymethylglutaryl-CoA reductase
VTLSPETPSLFKGFSKLHREERYQRLLAMGALTEEDIAFLKKGPHLDPNLGEHFIENMIGYMHLPLGIATHFKIDSKNYLIPMAVEETSIIAAASKTAKWIAQHGEINTKIQGHTLIGQIQLNHVENIDHAKQLIEKNAQSLIDLANEDIASSMVLRGGGVKQITTHSFEKESPHLLVIHVHVDTCDAMGANIITMICEYLKPPIEKLLQSTVSMCILSNLCDKKITTAEIRLRNIDEDLARKLVKAYEFSRIDPHRACTHNKGILNGIDPILIATGNDWRAVEAGMHAYACRDGQYRSLSHWRYENHELIGTLEAPIIVGIVGGVIRLHPTAQLALKILGVHSADELSRVIASVGLVQNLGAMRALVTEGIIEGHMKLHITNLSLSAGAQESEMPELVKHLEEIFKIQKRISVSTAKKILSELREKKDSVKAAVKAVLKTGSSDE